MIESIQAISADTSSIIIGSYHRRGTPSTCGFHITMQERLFNATLLVYGHRVRCLNARQTDVLLLDASLSLIPPAHLAFVLEQRPAGIRVSDSTGTGRRRRYTGGSNPGLSTTRRLRQLEQNPLSLPYDDPNTADFIDGEGIIITYGAFSEFAHLGVCPTVFHEFGHRMLYKNQLHAGHFASTNRDELNTASSSRSSTGTQATEGLCDAYMKMLCYGADPSHTSNSEIIRRWGANGRAVVSCSAATRAALRRTPAFSTMLDSDWIARYQER